MTLQAIHESYGAMLAQDGIPLHYGDLLNEYEAALKTAILLDRSHEGRVQLFGDSRFDILNRMSTNKMIEMNADEGRATIFTTPTARIIDRIVAYNRDDHLLMITEPGRSEWLQGFLQKNIFFGDDARVVNISSMTSMFSLHGVNADAVMQSLGVDISAISPMHGTQIEINGATIYAVRRKEVMGSHWSIIVSEADAVNIYQTILLAGEPQGLIPAGSLIYNTLRIRAGRPARPELNPDYIPLEVGLWDEVHFAKGCYTGQEIIARMESRAKLAKTIVALDMAEFIPAPADIAIDGRSIGKLTSSVEAPSGEIFAIALIKTSVLTIGAEVSINGKTATIQHLIGEQPDTINPT